MEAWLRDPDEIYRRSFATIRAEADLSAFTADAVPVVVRMIHACGMVDLAADVRTGGDAASAARRALDAGAPILVDSRMTGAGIIRRLLPRDNSVICTTNSSDTAARAKSAGTTRSAAGVDLWGDRLDGAVVVIGNAPTALFRLLEVLEDGAPRPAAILGFPVGFVGAAESKSALTECRLGVPFITVAGRRGGSAIAAAALNAIVGGNGEESPRG